MAHKYFMHILNSPKIMEKYGEVFVTVIPSKDQVERIFKIPFITALGYTICKPNPDDNSSEEAAVMKELDKLNAKKDERTLTAANKAGITPDDKIKKLIRVAASNGKAFATGYDLDGMKETIHTEESPEIVREKVDVSKIDVVQWLRGVALKLISKHNPTDGPN